jgi:hypothetical protein
MVAVYWDCERTVLLDPMQREMTFNLDVYISLLKKMKKLFHRVQPEKNLGEMLL